MGNGVNCYCDNFSISLTIPGVIRLFSCRKCRIWINSIMHSITCLVPFVISSSSGQSVCESRSLKQNASPINTWIIHDCPLMNGTSVLYSSLMARIISSRGRVKRNWHEAPIRMREHTENVISTLYKSPRRRLLTGLITMLSECHVIPTAAGLSRVIDPLANGTQ